MEREIQHAIRLALGARDDVVVWRNNVGTLRDRHGRFVRFGLCEGSADLIGIHKTSGRFLAIEIKNTRGKLSEAQRLFADLVTSCGGMYLLARSVDDVTKFLDEMRDP